MRYYKKSIFIASLFFLAIFLLSLASLAISSQFRSWYILLFGLIIGSCGSITCFLILKNWEHSLIKGASSGKHAFRSNKTTSNQGTENQEDSIYFDVDKQKETISELNEKTEAIHKLEKDREQFELRVEDINHELKDLKTHSEEELKRKTVLLSEYQETINQQREVIKKKQDNICELESRVQDLNYEVKTLLQLAEISGSSNNQAKNNEFDIQKTIVNDENPISSFDHIVTTPEKAINLLKRCIDNAQKITGANHFAGGQSRFRDLPIENFALDQRRLFDTLRNENSATVFVFSPKENRILFVNNQTNNLLGLSPDRFMQDFSEILREKETEWKQGVYQLSTSSQSKIRLLMKTKNGQDLLVNCNLGLIPTGIFLNHIIGVMHSS